MSIEFGGCIAFTAVSKDGEWMRCNDHWIEKGTTFVGILDSLAERLPNKTFAEIAWEVPQGIVWMDELVDSDFDPRYRHKYLRDQAKMAPCKIFGNYSA